MAFGSCNSDGDAEMKRHDENENGDFCPTASSNLDSRMPRMNSFFLLEITPFALFVEK